MSIGYDDEITLPDWIGETSLSLAEIGAIVCFACVKSSNDQHRMAGRLMSDDMTVAIVSLRSKGILKATTNGKIATIEIDLDLLKPQELNRD